MKICKACGMEYPNHLTACPNCGSSKIYTEEELAEEEIYREREIENRNKAIGTIQSQRMIVWGVLALVAVIVVVVIANISVNVNKPLSNGMSKSEGEEVLAEGIAYFEDGNYEAAMKCFAQLPSDSKQYEKAQSMLLQTKDSYISEVADKTETYVENGEYDSAFTLINQAMGILSDDADLQKIYDKTYSAYQTTVLAKVDSYVADEQYELALEYLENVLTQYPEDTVLLDAYNTTVSDYHKTVREEAIQQADGYVEEDDYPNAISTIEAAVDKIGEDEELEARLSTYNDKYVKLVIAKASKTYIPYDADSIWNAENIINNALDILPNNANLQSELASYQEKEPVNIIEMPASDEFFTSGKFSLIGTVKDCDGKEQKDTIRVEEFASYAIDDYGDNKWWLFCYKTIDTDFQYSKITGTLFQNPEYSNAATKTHFRISGYKDEEDEYTIKDVKINGKTDPSVDFEVNISGRKYITLYFLGDDGAGSKDEPYDYAYVSKLYLWK